MRRRQLRYKYIYVGLCFCFSLLFFFSPLVLAEKQPITHVVQKGDTLWSICDNYYGDPSLWPELWEMNKFITNPHWIKPGDVITLLEYEKEETPIPGKREATLQEEEPSELSQDTEKQREIRGIHVASLANVNALGFLRQNSIEPWGRIFDLATEKVLIGENDIVYVKMYTEGIQPGDTFTVYNISKPIKHPSTKEECGYIHSFKGVLMVEEVKEGYCVGRIRESFSTIYKDDLLMPYHPVSACVLPLPYHSDLTAHVIAAKDNLQLHGQYSVVYIDSGFEEGLRRGNIFEAIEERESYPEEKQGVALPPAILANILILSTTEHTSAGVVFWASKNFGNGVKIRPALWRTQFRGLSNLPTCPVE
jgi:LysM repeat protein